MGKDKDEHSWLKKYGLRAVIFTDGKKLSCQLKEFSGDSLLVEAEQTLILIPRHSVKYYVLNNTSAEDDVKSPKPAVDENQLISQTLGTEAVLPIEKIKVPEEFLQTTLNPVKTKSVMEYAKNKGYLDEPVTINRDHLLVDGYRRYYVAKELGWPCVPVIYKK